MVENECHGPRQVGMEYKGGPNGTAVEGTAGAMMGEMSEHRAIELAAHYLFKPRHDSAELIGGPMLGGNDQAMGSENEWGTRRPGP